METVPTAGRREQFPVFLRKADLGSYRRIALLSVVGKMMEAIINRTVCCWIEREKKLRDEQGGFKGERWCEDLTPLMLVPEWQYAQGAATCMCFIAVTKAYDTVGDTV